VNRHSAASVGCPSLRVEDGDADWWLASNQEEFASINALLPGPLKILENDDPLSDKVVEAAKN